MLVLAENYSQEEETVSPYHKLIIEMDKCNKLPSARSCVRFSGFEKTPNVTLIIIIQLETWKKKTFLESNNKELENVFNFFFPGFSPIFFFSFLLFFSRPLKKIFYSNLVHYFVGSQLKKKEKKRFKCPKTFFIVDFLLKKNLFFFSKKFVIDKTIEIEISRVPKKRILIFL